MVILCYGSFHMTDKRYNNGEWTQARFNSFVKGGLRSISQRWPPKYKCLSNAFTGTKVNPRTGRLAKHYLCRACQNEYVGSLVEVNHIDPVIPVTGFDSWDKVIERLFCEEDRLEVLCKPCHKALTKQENEERKRNAKNLQGL